jgi:hypothetical protein
MVTARELRVKLSLTDNQFKKDMKDIAGNTDKFVKSLKNASDDLDKLQNSINEFKPGDFISKIKINIKDTDFHDSIRNSIKQFNRYKHTVKLSVNEPTLNKTLREWIEKKSSGLNLQLNQASMRDSLNEWIAKASNKKSGVNNLNLRLDITKDNTLKADLEKFFKTNKFKVQVELPSMAKPSVVTGGDQKDEIEKTNDVVNELKGLRRDLTVTVHETLKQIRINTDRDLVSIFLGFFS